MSTRRRQLLLLGFLVVLFAAVAARQLLPGAGSSGSALARLGGSGGGSPLPGREAAIARLRLDALQHRAATYRPGRDPFRFGQAPPPPAAKPPPPPPVPRPSRAASPRPAAPAPPPAPQPPPVELVYLGSFGVPGREIAVFSDGKEIINAFEGDVVQTDFVVRRIGFESADIGFVDFPDAPAQRLAVGG